MTENKLVRGNVFIIPNNLDKTEDLIQKYYHSGDGWSATELMRRYDICSDLRVVDNGRWVRIWVTTPGNVESNWSDHGIDDIDGNVIEEAGFFPSSLPSGLFDGKDEGDRVSFKWGQYQIWLTLDQKSYRYRHCGSFQEAVAMVTAS
jgi:hypothetical protein